MATGPGIRVRVSAPPAEARKLIARLVRGGVPAAPDDGASPAELLIVSHTAPEELPKFRPRAGWLVALGAPGAPYFAQGADEVVVPGEPEILFRRMRMILERRDLLAKVERLNERVQALEAGLADAAHDVRSPLQAVIGNAELLSRDTSLTQKQRECAAAAARQGLRAMELAERILDSAKQRDRRVLDARPCDIGKLVEAVIQHCQQAASQRGVALVAVPPPRPLEVRADPELLGRVLENLVGNAIRHSSRGGQVEVAGWRASPKLVRLSVKDQGDGISAEELPKLVAGLGPGRGLRIARDIVERHGGDLWAESSVGNGTRFYVELALQPPSTRPKVLLVSDDARWLREVARTLKTACDVRTASPGQAKIGNRRTDMVLIDPSGPTKAHAKKFDALRVEAKDAQVPVIELPSETAAARLARTLAHLTP